jgi:hypothetical protein
LLGQEGQQVVALVFGKDLQGDGLEEVAALLHLADSLVAQP